ncbi:hypothetical protein METP2_03088 [Methanosarcinales archaeon]|nr:hypothetical protein [Candidatus Methanoperedens sp. BLZ2]KAB2947758.1 MAG: hypothetical protein F9K14_02810 [Candidatus Methanoperedens sp.]MBZ0176175.1 hypothetical protein [Candidatus Methanoperedens nitroreducens]CAG0998497.1 hypothetical protein METP2_03088 [Methanosarcinales archaeon]MCX9077401.1 hypothetical protein [Candidatus Methanoperedens sp.]MCX9089326.1 hypothetical protein [Candidatus Methanoperedens sp.]
MTDLRTRVEDDRGLLKKIELFIPGFKGYRKREDLRAADSLLRQQLARRMGEINKKFENCREELTRALELALISDMGDVLKLSRQIENKIRHTEQGYSGVSADIRIKEEELNKMYEWDLSLLQTIESIGKTADELNSSIIISDGTAGQKMKDIKKALKDFNLIFDKRISIITGLEVS